MKHCKKKQNVVVMEPVMFHRKSLVHVLLETLCEKVNITDAVSNISEVIRLAVLKGPADIYIMEAYGSTENYKNWNDFTRFIATYYPSVTCLIWTSKPTMFLRKFNAFNGSNPCWKIPKKIGVDSFLRFMTRVLDGETSPASTRIGHPISNLTPSEIVIITAILEGHSITSLARQYSVAYKTIHTHKRNAMIKMCISSTAQLRSFFIEGNILRDEKARCFPIETNANQPFLL